MIKKLIWLAILIGVLIFVLPKVFNSLSLFIDPTNSDIKRVIVEEDSGLLLPPEFDTLPVATNSAILVVHGFSQSAEEVELYINEIAKKKIVITKRDGSFKITGVRLFEGKNELTLVAYGHNEEKSDPSDPVVVTYKKSAPKLTISEPDDNTEKKGDDKTLTIAGVTDTDAEVTINNRWIRVSSNGVFNHKEILSDGKNTYEIVARDTAGNKNTKKITVRYSKE